MILVYEKLMNEYLKHYVISVSKKFFFTDVNLLFFNKFITVNLLFISLIRHIMKLMLGKY